MALLGIATWAWVALGAVALGVLVALARILTQAFAGIREAVAGLEESRRTLVASLARTREDLERLQDGLERINAQRAGRHDRR